jgi:hypothetical protein
LGQLHLAQFSQRQKEYPSPGFVSAQQEKNLSIWERQEKIDLPLADLHPRRQRQQQAKRVHVLGPHLCHLCSAQSCQSFSQQPAASFPMSSPLYQLSGADHPRLKSNGMQIDLVRAADDSQTWSEKVESMICVAVSSVGEDKEELTDLLKAHPNLVAWSQNVFGSTVPGVVCIR